MKTKQAKQFVVNKIRRGATAKVQVSYDTHEMIEVKTPKEFMTLATGKKVDRASAYHPKNGWSENEVTVCLDD